MATTPNSSDAFSSDFERMREGLSGAHAPWLDELRRQALESFTESGFPTVRNEDWKYTNVLPALRERLEPVLPGEVRFDDATVAPLLARATAIGSTVLVFVDGAFDAGHSKTTAGKGLKLSSLRARLETDAESLEPWLGKFLPMPGHGFTALNTAFLDDGAVIEIAEGAAIEEPVHVVYVSTARAAPYVTHPRNVIVARPGSSAMVVEHYIGAPAAKYLTNAASEISLERGAVLGHIRIQDESLAASHIARVEIGQAGGSTLVSHAFGFGAALSRTEISVKLGGEEAECRLAGLYAIDGSRHVDHHLMVDHASPRTRSDQLYKGVLEDSSRGVFTGRVLVRAGSQKIKAMQSNPSLLLGRGAVAETRPQLEIYADDVACNHGATIGRLSDDALFYLLTRGIDPREARRILVSGFAAEVVENIVPAALREALTASVAARMGRLGGAS